MTANKRQHSCGYCGNNIPAKRVICKPCEKREDLKLFHMALVHCIVAVFAVAGFFLMLVSVGSIEQDTVGLTQGIVQLCIGVVLLIVAAVIWLLKCGQTKP